MNLLQEVEEAELELNILQKEDALHASHKDTEDEHKIPSLSCNTFLLLIV